VPDDRPPCPACKTQTGVAFKVSVIQGTKTVTYRCVGCSHEWSANKPAIDSRLSLY
jgi:hypothetical protein